MIKPIDEMLISVCHLPYNIFPTAGESGSGSIAGIFQQHWAIYEEA